MLFNSYSFLLFFPIVVFLYFIIPAKARQVWLLIASYFFYMCWNWKYILLIMFITFVTYIAAIIIEKKRNRKKNVRKVLALCVTTSISLLVVFKYLDFCVDTVNRILSMARISAVNNPFSLVLPVGISFYTFQALSYAIDVYRGDTPVEKNFIRYALFVSFFPQLVAGPIERSGNLLRQIGEVPNKKNLFEGKRIKNGLYMMLWGMFLKMVIADRIAILVNKVFDEYYLYGTIGLAIGAVAFAIQIYCDFSSYSIIAIGAARVMGFSLMENFNTPYFADSIKDYWRRWHISLSMWFRDYVYIPLGGNRCSRVKKYRNIIITFGASGLWHGANWTFIAWGLLHGIYQIVGELTNPIRKRVCDITGINRNVFSYKLGRIIGTFILVDFSWILFRAESIGKAIAYIKRMLTSFDGYAFFNISSYDWGLSTYEINILIVSLMVLLCVSIIKRKKNMGFAEMLEGQNVIFKMLTVYVFIMAIVIFGEYGSGMSASDFIYFQF